MSLNSINISSEIKKEIIKPIPDYLIQQREGGGKKMLSYLSGNTIIDMLNKSFGYAWSWRVKREWVQESIPAINKYVGGSFCKDPKQWTLDPQGPVAHVICELTVYLTQEDGTMLSIVKEGYGSKSILGKQNDQESIFKAAGTDALKKAASLFGIGLDLYRNEDERYYFNEQNYEDPWTTEMKQKYNKELANLNSYIEMYQATDQDIEDISYAATGVDYQVYPDNIVKIMEYITEQLNIAESK